MSYTLKECFANPNNFGKQRNTSDIKYICIHYTGNDGDSDEANGNYFKNGIRNASAHYFVDSDSVTRSVADNYIAWSVGGGKYNDCSKTGGGKLYGVCTNANSISIELCDDNKDGVIKATQATIDNAIELTKFLMVKYGIPASNVIRHFDVNGKHCPAYWMDNTAWENEFHSKLTASSTTTPVATGATPYRVRKTWGDPKSQIGAYNDLNNAIKACKDGYTVFDNNGTVVYSKYVANSTTSTPTTSTTTNTVVSTITNIFKKSLNVHAYYQVIAGGKHYAEVCDLNDYAGVNEKKNITDVAARADIGSLKYRVHVKDGNWLGEVTGYNWADSVNGYAGNGREIDGVQFYFITPDGYVAKRAKYRVSIRGQQGFLPWVYDYEDFAGIFGKPIDGIQLCFE